MRFCSNCDNVLYTSLSDNDGNSLVYYCRHCGTKDAASQEEMVVVMNTQLKKTQMNFSSFINEFTKFDPTLPRLMKKCPNENCATNKHRGGGGDEEVEGGAKKEGEDEKSETLYLRYDDNELKYLYMCTVCDTVYTN